MEEEVFWEVPKGLKALIGRLIGAPEDEVILGNSTTYGLHLWRAACCLDLRTKCS
jgi:cysteine desulfurase / selenocysteine lyase